ncbi:hypothetical protein E4659_10525 [Dickeya dianthicola]|uniref:Uncharacterized protein n=1 Tax=Dickeya dianthicola TaxID=204039 RepID=A0AAX1C6T4_9GAMM|nr:hypothetical protein [Dickeya dianthicola]MBI0449345.1 hypothetical protein [Dickeya dianthicola]MBI0453866.1 hypothetical protein [Dickeya dianthicola]MBI0458086.1 hypothetical protein [Dickeya dianthicola]MBI0462822.1 hypothetical protein [Dickeya dianthicola]
MGQSVVLAPVPAGWCCKRSDKHAVLARVAPGSASAVHLRGDAVRPFASGYRIHRRTASSAFIARSWLMIGAGKAAAGKGGPRHDN